jgi:hypothetical protein
MKLPLRPNTRIHAPVGNFGNLCRHIIRRMPSDRKLAYHLCKPCDPNASPLLRSLQTASSHNIQTGNHRPDRWLMFHSLTTRLARTATATVTEMVAGA